MHRARAFRHQRAVPTLVEERLGALNFDTPLIEKTKRRTIIARPARAMWIHPPEPGPAPSFKTFIVRAPLRGAAGAMTAQVPS